MVGSGAVCCGESMHGSQGEVSPGEVGQRWFRHGGASQVFGVAGDKPNQ